MKRGEKKQSVFDQVLAGLKDGIAHARGEVTLRTTDLPAPAPELSKTRVAAIRKKVGMSQAVFATVLNVPTKTLQSWEQGARAPKAGEARLLQICEAGPKRFLSLVEDANASTGRNTNRVRRKRSIGA